MSRLPLHSIRLIFFISAPILCGFIALLSGMDGSWDLRNYHYYNGWALLTGHIGRDLLVSQTPSFYNPLLDVPFAWAARHFSARTVAFALGALHGGDFILLTRLAESLLSLSDQRRRFYISATLAAAGCGGAVALSEIGTVFYDNVTSLGLLGTLLLLTLRWDRLARGTLYDAARCAVWAGLPLGLAFGLKQTMILYVAGTGLALLVALPAPAARRIAAGFWFGLGMGLAMLAGGGFWMVHLWHLYGNPLFPYFNEIFHSAWGLGGDYRDVYYQPKDWLHRLFFPVFFTFNSRIAAEVPFFDARILALFALIPLSPLLNVHKRPRTLFLVLAIALAYVVWLKLFAIYRYLVAVEMLAPLTVMLICEELPRRWALNGGLAIVLVLCATTRPANWIRMPFSDRPVEVSLPPIADPDHSLVLIAGHEPLSFLIPAFPETMRFLRIDSTFTNPDQTAVPFNRLMEEQIDAHQGPLLALFIPIERHDVVKRLGNDGLTLESEGCGIVSSPIGAMDYSLCPVTRK